MVRTPSRPGGNNVLPPDILSRSKRAKGRPPIFAKRTPSSGRHKYKRPKAAEDSAAPYQQSSPDRPRTPSASLDEEGPGEHSPGDAQDLVAPLSPEDQVLQDQEARTYQSWVSSSQSSNVSHLVGDLALPSPGPAASQRFRDSHSSIRTPGVIARSGYLRSMRPPLSDDSTYEAEEIDVSDIVRFMDSLVSRRSRHKL